MDDDLKQLGAGEWLIRVPPLRAGTASSFTTSRQRTRPPRLFAALAEVHLGIQPDERDGFVIITAVADQGLLDINGRKPFVLGLEQALVWINPDTSPAHAPEIVESGGRPTADFKWHPVKSGWK